VPEHGNVDDIVAWLANRDAVIRSLLAQRLPTLTPLAVMVADLQQSIRICSELPAEEYFELINQIWTTLDPIFRRYYGAYGKHTGDGMLYYFFPQPDQNYLLNSMTCAFKIKEAMKRINHEWLQKKQWNNELFMNIGLNSGEEWLGTFKTNNHLELIVLGETINTAARLSDFARYGQIWATKQLIGKLPMQDREKVTYGIQPAGERKNFIGNSFSLVENLVDGPLTGTKLADIQGVAVAEVINFKDD
jgi:class 3 adenylate cyclase